MTQTGNATTCTEQRTSMLQKAHQLEIPKEPAPGGRADARNRKKEKQRIKLTRLTLIPPRRHHCELYYTYRLLQTGP